MQSGDIWPLITSLLSLAFNFARELLRISSGVPGNCWSSGLLHVPGLLELDFSLSFREFHGLTDEIAVPDESRHVFLLVPVGVLDPVDAEPLHGD